MACHWDESFIQLKCGTKLYRMVWGDKQCLNKYTRQFPGEKWDPMEQVINRRAAVGNCNLPCTVAQQEHTLQQMTYEQVKRNCLEHHFQKTA
jgi:hypothetical protein